MSKSHKKSLCCGQICSKRGALLLLLAAIPLSFLFYLCICTCNVFVFLIPLRLSQACPPNVGQSVTLCRTVAVAWMCTTYLQLTGRAQWQSRQYFTSFPFNTHHPTFSSQTSSPFNHSAIPFFLSRSKLKNWGKCNLWINLYLLSKTPAIIIQSRYHLPSRLPWSDEKCMYLSFLCLFVIVSFIYLLLLLLLLFVFVQVSVCICRCVYLYFSLFLFVFFIVSICICHCFYLYLSGGALQWSQW